jgi:hypothetical protein
MVESTSTRFVRPEYEDRDTHTRRMKERAP